MEEIKEKWLTNGHKATIVALCLVFGAAALMLGTYPKIKEAIATSGFSFYEEAGFYEDYIFRPAYNLYYELVKDDNGKELTPTEVFIKDVKSFDETTSRESFDEDILRWGKDLYQQGSSLQYYAKNTVNGDRVSNFDKGYLNEKGEIDYKWLESHYQYAIQIVVDSKGNVSIPYIYGASLLEAKINGSNYFDNAGAWYVNDTEQFRSVRDMTYLFAVPKKLNLINELDFRIEQKNHIAYQEVSISFILGVTLIFIISTLFIPIRWIKEVEWFKKLQKLSVEVLVGGIILGLTMVVLSAISMIQECMNGEMYYFFNFYMKPLGLSDLQIWLFNGLFWIIGYGLVLISIWLIKAMLYEGLGYYLKQNSLLAGIYQQIKSINQKAARRMANTPIEQTQYKYIKKIIIWNSLLLALLCCLWFFGIIGVLIYGIIIYVISKRAYLDIVDKYEKLMTITGGMTSGNLGVHVTEDLGLFNPLKEQLAQIQTGFKTAVDEAVKSQKMKTDLITNVSHDLKTPLTSIISYVDLLKDENLSEEKRKQYIETLERKSQRLQILIEDLFEMSKVSSGNITLQKESVDVVALLKQTLFELEDRLALSQLSVRTNFPESKVKLQLDSMRTYRIFDNLINNMAKYSLPGSRVYVEVYDMGSQVEVILKNIAREELNFDSEEITERFVRGDQSRHTEGSGLGLAIAKSFTELQGGKLQVATDGDLFKVSITFNKP